MVDSAHDAYIQYPTARSVPFVVLNITFGAMTRTIVARVPPRPRYAKAST